VGTGTRETKRTKGKHLCYVGESLVLEPVGKRGWAKKSFKKIGNIPQQRTWGGKRGKSGTLTKRGRLNSKVNQKWKNPGCKGQPEKARKRIDDGVEKGMPRYTKHSENGKNHGTQEVESVARLPASALTKWRQGFIKGVIPKNEEYLYSMVQPCGKTFKQEKELNMTHKRRKYCFKNTSGAEERKKISGGGKHDMHKMKKIKGKKDFTTLY